MDSIGEKLKATREAKKLSIREVANETNIAPTYIEALEKEDFDKFPSETYIIGFLRAYSELLKLNEEEMIQLYKGYKIGESATPIEELTRPTKSPFMIQLMTIYDNYRNYIFAGAAAIVSILFIWGIWSMTGSNMDLDSDAAAKMKKEMEQNQNSNIRKVKNIQLSNNKGNVYVYKGEAVQFLVDNKEVVFSVKEITPEKTVVTLQNYEKEQALELNKQAVIVLNGLPREVLLTLKGQTESSANIMIELGNPLEVQAVATDPDSNMKPLTEGDNTKVIAQSNKNLKITFEVKFVQKSFIEVYLDGNRKQKGFMPAGAEERWEASESIQLKIGNAGGINAKINGKDYVFGRQGQVANKIITWKKDPANPNVYHLEVRDW